MSKVQNQESPEYFNNQQSEDYDMTFHKQNRRVSNQNLKSKYPQEEDSYQPKVKREVKEVQNEGFGRRNKPGKISDNSEDGSTISTNMNKKVTNVKQVKSKSNGPDNKNLVSAISLLLEELSVKDLSLIRDIVDRRIDYHTNEEENDY